MKTLKDYILIILGDLLLATSVSIFLLPNQLSTGGFSGLATIINYFLDIKVGTIIIGLNIIFIIYSAYLFGFKFIFRTTISILIYGLFSNLLQDKFVVTNDLLLASVCGGILSGTGIGLNLIANSTTGGSELIAKISNHYFKKVGLTEVIVIFDIIIIGLFIFVFKNIDVGLYSIIAIFISKKAIDIIVEGINYAKAVYIISNKTNEIADIIIQKLSRGVTLLNSEGYYTKNKKQVIYCVVNKYQLSDLKEIVKNIDTNAFVIINEAKEVLGNGFSKN
ncbi:MAG: YitT family protein [Clostridiales bacterium]|nr:YitT family protein [Clostridiales bacterium]